jgi:hypothetical protein
LHNDKSKELNFNGYKCVSYEGNKNLFYARRFGVLNAKGDHIQFSDIDDDIFKVEYKDLDCDLISYRYTINDEKDVKGISVDTDFKDMTDEEKKILSINMRTGVWNKLYKKSILMKLYNDYPAFEGFFKYEDFFLNYALLDYIKSIRFDSQTIYHYLPDHPDELNEEAIDFCEKNMKDGLGKKLITEMFTNAKIAYEKFKNKLN